MTTTFEDANELVRAAVAMRREAQAAGKPHEEWYDVSQPVTEPRNIVASTEDLQHVEWTGRDEDALIETLTRQRLRGDGLLGNHGTTAKFGTGAVRSDTVEAFRYDLVSPIGLREVARACAEGAEKYGDWNWEKGMPVHDLLNHAIAHIYGFLSGDRSEPHLGHAAWNLLAAIHSDELWPELNAGTLRGSNCKAPTA